MVLISFLNVSYKYIFLLCQTQIASLCWIYFQISWQAAGKMANIKPTPCKTWKWKLTTGFLFCKSFSTHSIHQKIQTYVFPRRYTTPVWHKQKVLPWILFLMSEISMLCNRTPVTFQDFSKFKSITGCDITLTGHACA